MEMKVLITHEESQTVMEAFLNAGHDAYSNDLLPCSGKYPERHLRMDCFEAIKLISPDFLGMHPECTRLTVAANKYYLPMYADRFPNIHIERAEAVDHFTKCAEALERIGKGYIENPIGIMSRLYEKPTQIIQPYMWSRILLYTKAEELTVDCITKHLSCLKKKGEKQEVKHSQA